MPESNQNREVFSLLEVTRSIQKTLADRYRSAFWVKAELNKLNYYSHSGHCYPDLVEKQNGKVIAQMRSNLWKDDFIEINSKFLRILKEPLKDGIKVLFLARISFDPAYGLALRILDMDPSYTLGDLEREKQETITRLQNEEIFHRNRKLDFPFLPQRIAIISVETSKGYADFLKVVEGNNWNYKFFHFLFPSLLQGEKAVSAIIAQLSRIRKVISHFDVVAIIRGGGGDIGLSCYNDYRLSKAIAGFPLPVITGIGHATNETVVEMVAYHNAITPTKLAEFLVQKFHDVHFPVQKASEIINDRSRKMIINERSRLQSEVKLFRSVSQNILFSNRNEIRGLTQSLLQQTQYFCTDSRQELKQLAFNIKKDARSMIQAEQEKLSGEISKLKVQAAHQIKLSRMELGNEEKNISLLSPLQILKRGFSITRLNGKAVKNLREVSPGDQLETELSDGKLISIAGQKTDTGHE